MEQSEELAPASEILLWAAGCEGFSDIIIVSRLSGGDKFSARLIAEEITGRLSSDVRTKLVCEIIKRDYADVVDSDQFLKDMRKVISFRNLVAHSIQLPKSGALLRIRNGTIGIQKLKDDEVDAVVTLAAECQGVLTTILSRMFESGGGMVPFGVGLVELED